MFNQFNSFNNFIFDLDGTLADSSSEVLNCLERAFIECNVIYDKSRITTDIMGPSLAEIVKMVVPKLNDEKTIQDIVIKYRYLYDYNENDKTKLYDGIFDWLKHLKQNDKKIFIATNKPKIPTMRLVRQLNINFFNDIYTPDKHENKKITKQQMIEEIISKHLLQKNETVMVGDIMTDIDAAHKAGIKAITVMWGYAKDKNIIKNKSDFYLERLI